ncbi:MAG: hypothetical protein AB1414_06065 [bacterium]
MTFDFELLEVMSTATIANKTIPVTIQLTPSQILEAYERLLKVWRKKRTRDWLEKPEILAMLEREALEAEKELREGKTISLEQLKKELKI